MGTGSTGEGWWREFVAAEPPHTAKLAVVRKDGSPHVSPVWVALDGDDLMFTTYHTSLKAKALRRDGRVALCFDDERPPFAFVVISGRVEITEDPAQLRLWATRIGGRYMGADRAREYGERNSVPGEYLVRVKVDKVVTNRSVAG